MNIVNCDSSDNLVSEKSNSLPEPKIISPLHGSPHNEGTQISFEGFCNDSNDGELSCETLVWSSDLDGFICEGGNCISETLRIGSHEVTLTVTDLRGNVGTDVITITVIGGTASSFLPDTGQNYSYTDIFGEDADYNINPPSYTKLDSEGNELEITANKWAMVRDNITGLVWEIKTDDESIHGINRTFTWREAQDIFISSLNVNKFGGYSDWRLPEVIELSVIINPDVFMPSAINQTFFSNTMSSPYWTSNIFIENPTKAWYVSFYDGYVYNIEITDNYFVRAVRGENSMGVFLDNFDGTITDTRTGLMWQKKASGVSNWESAIIYCEDLSIANYNDWRLPNRNELHSLVDYDTYNPSTTMFTIPNGINSYFWSSSTSTGTPGAAWSVDFYYGYVYSLTKTNSFYIRAVRNAE